MDDGSDPEAPSTTQNAQWRLRAVTEDDLDYLEACTEAEHCALDLIANARHEAAEQGSLALHHAQLAMEYAARQLELLQLAERAERTIRNSTHILLPHHDPLPPD